ncbi:MAG: response regulator [Pseudomonadota bacterium]|nr:response regulator [Pseudomonadota bacterium]
MSLILLIDDNQHTRLATTELLQDQGWAVVAADTLQAARRHLVSAGRKLQLPDLCLVELVLRRGNGFTAGALLARHWRDRISAVPTLLISDRLQSADTAWARARGMSGVVSRCSGPRGMVRQISKYLQGQPESRILDLVANKQKCDAESAPGGADDCVAALAKLLLASLRQLLAQAMQIPPDRDESIAEWRQAAMTSLQGIRHCWCFLPKAVSFGQQGQMNELQLADARALCSMVLKAVETLASFVDCRQACDWMGPRQRCKAALAEQLELCRERNKDGQQNASLTHAARAALGLHAVGAANTRGWLLLVLKMLYFPHARSASSWQTLSTALQTNDLFAPLDGSEHGPADLLSTADTAERLRHHVSSMLAESRAQLPDRTVQAEFWYKLSALLRMQENQPVLLIVMADSWYRQAALTRHTMKSGFTDSLRCFQSLLDPGLSEIEKIDQALTVVRLSLASTGAELALSQSEQLELASNLYWLPHSRDWAAGLSAEQADLDLFVEELGRELNTVCEAAARLEIAPLGSLSLVLLQFYRAIQLQPALLNQTTIRRPLIIAQHQLCKMLDRVAAWQQADPVGLLVERLYRLLESGATDSINPCASGGQSATYSVHESEPRAAQGWAELDAGNQRLWRLLNSSADTAGLKPVLLELLKMQRDTIKRHLAYQPPG